MSQIERFINNVTPLDAKHLNGLVDTLNTLVDKNETVQVDIGNLNDEIENINVLKSQFETIEKKVDDHIETSIDDTTISTDRTWSSAKIEDFVHINDDVVWATAQRENLSVDYSKEGYLREVEIWGNTWQDDTDSKNLWNPTFSTKESFGVSGVAGNGYYFNSISGLKPNSSYTLSIGKIIVPANGYYRIGIGNSDSEFSNSTVKWIVSENNNANDTSTTLLNKYGTNTTGEDGILKVWVWNSKGTSTTEWLFDVCENIQLEEGTIATDYVDYHKADLSDIQHLGELYVDSEGQPILDSEGREQYKIEIKSCNNNFIPMGKYLTDSIKGVTYSYDNGNISIEGTNSAYSGFDLATGYVSDKFTLYKMSKEALDYFKDKRLVTGSGSYNITADFFTDLTGQGTNGLYVGMYIIYDDINYKSMSPNLLNTNTFKLNTTIDVNHHINGIFAGVWYSGFNYSNTFIKNIQIKLNTDGSYLLPKSNKTTLLLPCQLMKVGDVADRLYWDSEKGKYIVEKKVDKMNITSIQAAGYEVDDYRYGGRFSDARFESGIIKGEGIFSHGKYINRNTAEEPTFNALYGKTIGGSFGIKILKTELESQDQAGLNKWLEGKEVYSYQPLVTTQLIETNITKEILVPCYKDKTHLFVTGGLDGTIKAKIPLDGGQAIQSLSVMNLALNEEVSTLSLENEELKSTNDTQDELINTTMLATDEMYMMIEPLLLEAVQTLSLERSVSKMVDMYVAMVQRGLKTIDEVPSRYREQVKEIIAQLEK